MINFHRHRASDIDVEMFLVDEAFKLGDTREASEAQASLKQQKLFCCPDRFGRLPLHYLFFDADQFATNGLTEAELYKRAGDEEVPHRSCQVRLTRHERPIDPVELLTVLLRQMGGQGVDEKDLAGFTALHYAAVRGSTIACTLLMSSGCSVAKHCNAGNSALASAVFFKRETCTLTLLRALTEKDSLKRVLSQSHSGLNSVYHLHAEHPPPADEASRSPHSFKSTRMDTESDLYPVRSQPLYKLILAQGWEGNQDPLEYKCSH